MHYLASFLSTDLRDGYGVVNVYLRDFFKIVLNVPLLYSVLFKTVNVAKNLETSWSQRVGMLCKQEKLLVRMSWAGTDWNHNTSLLYPQYVIDKNIKL